MDAPSSVTIVGASLAGMHGAHTLRKEGYQGQITVIGDEPHLPYDRPPLSKQVLAGAWDTDRIGLPAATEDLDLEWRLGRRAMAFSLQERRLDLDNGERVDVDGLLIATGAVPRRLSIGVGLEGVHVLRTLDDCMALRGDLETGNRVVVIGAGFIGAEVAATARERGLEVALLEALPVAFDRTLGPEIGSVVVDLHRQHGVDVRLGVAVAGIEGSERVERVVLSDGTHLPADVVLIGIGVRPATDWLEGSGLALDDGVLCDETCLAAPGVTAAGDVARWPSRRFGRLLRIEHWEHAIQQGEAAARRLLAGDDAEQIEVFDPVPWFWTDQYDRKIQLAGVASLHDRVEVVEGSLDEHRFVALYGEDDRVVAVLGMNRPRHVMQLRPLVERRASFEEGLEVARSLS